jgi:hypothetical protein
MAYAAIDPSCTGQVLFKLSTATVITSGAWFRNGPITNARDILFFVSGSVITMNSHGWQFTDDGAQRAASNSFSTSSGGTGSGLNRRIALRVLIASNNSIFPSGA